MNKSDLVKQVSKRLSYVRRKDTKLIVDLIFSSMTDALIKGGKIEIRGFGSFRVKNRSSKIGKNPKTGEKVRIPSKNVPFFKVGKQLRTIVDY